MAYKERNYMKISNKLKAAGVCAGIVAVAVGGGYVLQFIAENVDPATVGLVCGGFVASALLYMMYQVILARLDYEDNLKNVTQSITEKQG